VSHGARELTLACLRSVLASQWPPDRLEVVLVDNASSDSLVAAVRDELPAVEVIENRQNLGFAAGANLGLRDRAGIDYLALVNNDATVEPGWLRPLIGALEADRRLGAAAPKILLASSFTPLVVRAPTSRRGRGDRRELGVRFSGVRVEGRDVLARTKARRGTWGPEPDGEWTGPEAELLIPVPPSGADHCGLRLDAERPTRVTTSSGSAGAELDVDRTPSWFSVPLDTAATDIINNAGSELTADDFGFDRGYLDPDDGRFDATKEVLAWCGAAVLLRRAYLDDVGLFDERLFLYYEDLELAWRGQARGWRYEYVPTSVVRHVHAATSVEAAPRTRVLIESNRLLVLSRHAGWARAVRALLRFVLVTASYARRDVVSPVLHGRRPVLHTVALRARALARYLSRLPWFLPRRARSAAAQGEES
jgi:GT2 family glycosyltransferase